MRRLLRPTALTLAAMLTTGAFATVPALGALAAEPVTGSSRTLVFGDSDNGFEGDNLAQTLTEHGQSVDRRADLPEDLSGYGTVWDVDAYTGLDGDEEQRLVEYVQSGGGLYLTGERPCCESINGSVQRVLDALLRDRDVEIGGQGDIEGPFTFNPAAVGAVTRVPDTLIDFVPQSPGGMAGIGGVNAPNVLASNGSVAVGGVWISDDLRSGTGRVAVLMDVDYLGDESRVPIVMNLANFLSGGLGCSDDGGNAAFLWGDEVPENCSTIPVTAPIDFAVEAMRGTTTVTVQSSWGELDCDYRSDEQGGAGAICDFTAIPPTGITVTVAAVNDVYGESHLYFRVVPKNDPRNVPTPFSLASDWWLWPDADDDGIPDKWERDGVWVDGVLLDLPALGAQARHKDLFLYIDYEEGYQLSDETLGFARDSYAASPLGNPDGATGITLHTTIGASVPSSIANGDYWLTEDDIQKVGTYTGYLASPYAGGGGVPKIFKHVLNYNRTEDTTLGAAFVKGSEAFTAYEDRARSDRGTISDRAFHFSQATNLVHEVGHLLGLKHHGSRPEPELDPRYKSVMSYTYNVEGVVDRNLLGFPINRRIDYARDATVNLDWRRGQSIGQLTFVIGQDGEQPDFYETSHNEAIHEPGELPDEPTSEELMLVLTPSDENAFAEEFGYESTLDFPLLEPVAPWDVVSPGGTVTLKSHDTAGSPQSLLIESPPAHGTATVDGLVLSYASAAGFAGPDTITVRSTNGTLSSDPVTISVNVSAPPAPTVSRIGGADRYQVAINVSKATHPGGADTVYVVTGENYPDALSAGPAAVRADAPLLLTPGAQLSPSVEAEIRRLTPSRIVVVGGPNSVSAKTFAQLKGIVHDTVRVSGADRYEASRALARFAFGESGADLAYVATGVTFPDALSAGGAGGSLGGPVVLVPGTAESVDQATTQLLDGLGVQKIRIAGGPASVSAGIETSLRAIAPTLRLFGPDRFTASAAINADAYASSSQAILVTGLKFPDALAGSAWAGAIDAPLFVSQSDCVPGAALDAMTAMGVRSVTLLGGTASLSPNVAALTRC